VDVFIEKLYMHLHYSMNICLEQLWHASSI